MIKKVQETYNTFTFYLELDQPFQFKPGQYVILTLTIDGEKLNRAYTISSSPTLLPQIALTIQDFGTHQIAKYLNDNVAIGETVELRGPYGKFYWEEGKSDKLFMITMGNGITPYKAIIDYIRDKNLDIAIKLLYSVPTKKDIIFYDAFMQYQKEHPTFTPVFVLSEEKPADWKGYTGEITKEILSTEIKGFEDGLFYVCGFRDFANPIKQHLLDLGISKEHIVFEGW